MYSTELEKVEVFNGFQDFVETFFIHRGKVKSKAEEEETIVGEFKVKVVEDPQSLIPFCGMSNSNDNNKQTQMSLWAIRRSKKNMKLL